jgi:hypothetical protein
MAYGTIFLICPIYGTLSNKQEGTSKYFWNYNISGNVSKLAWLLFIESG